MMVLGPIQQPAHHDAADAFMYWSALVLQAALHMHGGAAHAWWGCTRMVGLHSPPIARNTSFQYVKHRHNDGLGNVTTPQAVHACGGGMLVCFELSHAGCYPSRPREPVSKGGSRVVGR